VTNAKFLERELHLASQTREELDVANAVIRLVYGTLEANAPDAIERAKRMLASFLEDQRRNGR